MRGRQKGRVHRLEGDELGGSRGLDGGGGPMEVVEDTPVSCGDVEVGIAKCDDSDHS